MNRRAFKMASLVKECKKSECSLPLGKEVMTMGGRRRPILYTPLVHHHHCQPASNAVSHHPSIFPPDLIAFTRSTSSYSCIACFFPLASPRNPRCRPPCREKWPPDPK